MEELNRFLSKMYLRFYSDTFYLLSFEEDTRFCYFLNCSNKRNLISISSIFKILPSEIVSHNITSSGHVYWESHGVNGLLACPRYQCPIKVTCSTSFLECADRSIVFWTRRAHSIMSLYILYLFEAEVCISRSVYSWSNIHKPVQDTGAEDTTNHL